MHRFTGLAFGASLCLGRLVGDEENFLERTSDFELRKSQHLNLALEKNYQASSLLDFHKLRLVAEALPDLNFSDVSIQTETLGRSLKTPFMISSMTAGHEEGDKINQELAQAASERGWILALGSQRGQLKDPKKIEPLKTIRKEHPNLFMLGNIGLSQLLTLSHDQIEDLIMPLKLQGLFVHLNALQECLQPENQSPCFQGGLEALDQLSKKLSCPLLVKETGCGFSAKTLSRLGDTSISVVDVSGAGGTHWGRLEGARNQEGTLYHRAAETFKDWGFSTVESLSWAMQVPHRKYEVWASGGVRSGLDAAKLFAMGAKVVGVAYPLLKAYRDGGQESLLKEMEQFEYELKLALFLTGCSDMEKLRSNQVLEWKQNETF